MCAPVHDEEWEGGVFLGVGDDDRLAFHALV